MARYAILTGLVVVAAAIALLYPQRALAQGEKYTWEGTNVIVGSGGEYRQPVKFNKVTPIRGASDYRTNGTVTFKNGCVSQMRIHSFKGEPGKAGSASISYLRNSRDRCTANITEPGISVAAPGGSGGGGGKTEEPDGGGDGDDAVDGNCLQSAGAFSWILCPLINLGVETVGSLTKMIEQLLYVTPLNPQGGPDESGLYGVWKAMRDLANVVFVLVFLAIVFSNTLSLNIDAYTIKKLLPKLVVAAVLVQASFFLCSIMIDVGNVAGRGVGTLINTAVPPPDTQVPPEYEGFRKNQTPGPSAGERAADIGGWLTAGLVGAFVIAAAAFVTMVVGPGVIGLVVLSLAIGLIGVFLTLAARKLIIGMLVVLSPLALAAWVLPGTENFFKLWYKNLTKIILMYPLIVLILSVSGVLSQVALSGDSKSVNNIMASLIPIIAFFSIPATFKMSGSLMSGASNAILSRSRPLSKRALKPARELGKEKSSLAMKDFKVPKRLQNTTAGNIMGKGGRLAGRTVSGNLFTFGAIGRRKRAVAYESARDAQLKDAVSAFKEAGITSNKDRMAIALAGLRGEKSHRGVSLNDYVTEAAIKEMAANGAAPELQTLYDGGEFKETLPDGKEVTRHVEGLYDHARDERKHITDAAGNKVRNPNYGKRIQIGTTTDKEGKPVPVYKKAGFRSAQADDLWARGLEGKGSALIGPLRHAVHGQKDAALETMSGSNLGGMHGAEAKALDMVVQDPSKGLNGLQAMVDALRQVGETDTLRSSVASENLAVFLENADKFEQTEVKVAGVPSIKNGKQLIEKYVTEGGGGKVTIQAIQTTGGPAPAGEGDAGGGGGGGGGTTGGGGEAAAPAGGGTGGPGAAVASFVDDRTANPYVDTSGRPYSNDPLASTTVATPVVTASASAPPQVAPIAPSAPATSSAPSYSEEPVVMPAAPTAPTAGGRATGAPKPLSEFAYRDDMGKLVSISAARAQMLRESGRGDRVIDLRRH